MTWQVEHAQEPPQAPSEVFSKETDMPLGDNGQTFHLKVFRLSNVQQIIPICNLKYILLTFLVDKRDFTSTRYRISAVTNGWA